jgi:RimJ/RimL family protein N-acetyltransferase
VIYLPKTEPEREYLCAWAAHKVGLDLGDFGVGAQPIGFIVTEKLEAVAVYHNYRGGCIEISFATQSPRWANRGAIEAVFAYPFRQLDVRRLTAITKKQNRRVRKLLEGTGFILEGKLRAAFPDDDGCLYAMTRDYYLRSKWNGQISPEAATRA